MAEDEKKDVETKEEKKTPSKNDATEVGIEKKSVKIKRMKPKTAPSEKKEIGKKEETGEKAEIKVEKEPEKEMAEEEGRIPAKTVVKKKVKPEKKEEEKPKELKKKVEKKKVEGEEEEDLKEEEAEEAEEEEEVEEEEVEIIEEEEYKVKIKPELSKNVKDKLKIRREIKKRTPKFRRQEWFRYKRLGTSWRKPRGLHSKARQHMGYRTNVVSIGYGSPADTRNLHPSGFKEIMVYNVGDLERINPRQQAARIGHSVGTRKRIEIEEAADEKGIRVLNPRRL